MHFHDTNACCLTLNISLNTSQIDTFCSRLISTHSVLPLSARPDRCQVASCVLPHSLYVTFSQTLLFVIFLPVTHYMLLMNCEFVSMFTKVHHQSQLNPFHFLLLCFPKISFHVTQHYINSVVDDAVLNNIKHWQLFYSHILDTLCIFPKSDLAHLQETRRIFSKCGS